MHELPTIRPATPADAAGIARVQVATWRDTYGGMLPPGFLVAMSEARERERWRALLSRQLQVSGVRVAESPGKGVVGYGSFGRHRFDASIDAGGEFYDLYVAPEAQGQKIGRRLLAAMAQGLLARQIGSALVWVIAVNPSRWFYAHLGGRMIAERHSRFAGQPVSLIAYRWSDRPAMERLALCDDAFG